MASLPIPPGNDQRIKTISPELLAQAEKRVHFDDFFTGLQSMKTGAVAIALFGGLGGIALPSLIASDFPLPRAVELLCSVEIVYALYCLWKALGTKRNEALETIVREPYNLVGLSPSTHKDVRALWNLRNKQATNMVDYRGSGGSGPLMAISISLLFGIGIFSSLAWAAATPKLPE